VRTSVEPESLADLLVGRQPICDRNMEVVAYELLFRDRQTASQARITDADNATAKVILNAVLEIGLDNIVGPLPAFINLTRSFILGRYQLPLPSGRVILEVLEDVTVDEELIEGLTRLKAQGYSIALDDFLFQPEYETLVQLADIVKLDLMALDREELIEHARILAAFDVELLAEKVEDRKTFEDCRALGFDYYQGFFFAEPQTITAPRTLTSRPSALQQLGQLLDPEIRGERLCSTIETDVALSYRVINAVNAAYYSLPKRIDSIADALSTLGDEGVRNLSALLILTGVERKPKYLVQTLLTRAKMAERLAIMAEQNEIEDYFAAGMLSVLPPLLDLPIQAALSGLRIKASLRDALLDRRGPVAEVLDCVLRYERSEWEDLHCFALDIGQIRRAYLQAITWSNQTHAELMN
jgi:EAL and modified HD-GYP domain-containing signal transduction protein